ncbi:phage tail assembly protein [Telmatospirillum sp. J64-1]|uniref:phage tail assembly protein n=1 Tax=Telmatospirillum sp. J64-1 TaxID=2502183 RepID=UPI00115DB679|nr:phage tail assembly protein [Telmatospirillum sp. J64-1]
MNTKPFTFSNPIPYGDKDLTEITLRRPMAGDLRGIKLRGLHDMEVDTLLAIVPRIATPQITAGQLAAMDAADTLRLIEEVSGFFTD